MENNDLLGSQLMVDDITTSHLHETAKWGKFLAIVGFIFCGLFVLVGLGVSLFMGSASSVYATGFAGMGAFLGIFYVLLALLYFFPCLYLFRFSTKMKMALAAGNQELLNEAFGQHRRMYKFMGILTIVVIAFYLLAIVFGGLAAAMF